MKLSLLIVQIFAIFQYYVMLTWEKIPGSPHFSILRATKSWGGEAGNEAIKNPSLCPDPLTHRECNVLSDFLVTWGRAYNVKNVIIALLNLVVELSVSHYIEIAAWHGLQYYLLLHSVYPSIPAFKYCQNSPALLCKLISRVGDSLT